MPFSAHTWPFFALTTCGLETVSAQEIAALPQISIDTISYRRISGTCSGSLNALCSLRTVDDVFLQIATWNDIGRPRSSLEKLRDLGNKLDLRAVALCCARLRPLRTPPVFSLTVSFVGKRNYTGEEMKAVLAQAITEKHRGWIYQPDDRLADLNIRVFLEHDVATIGVRVGKTALHERSYQRVHLPGALKPSVAAALVLLARATPATMMLDPCCGSGTILIEAALQGAHVHGGDYNPHAITAARTNIAAAGINACIQQWDAQALPLADDSMDCIITNLPWGRQVPVCENLPTLYRRIFRQMRRVLAPGGRLVVLANAPWEIDPLDLVCTEQIEISLFGQRPGILIFAEH